MAIPAENASQRQDSVLLLDPRITRRLRDPPRGLPALEHQDDTGRFGVTPVEDRFAQSPSLVEVGKHQREPLQFGVLRISRAWQRWMSRVNQVDGWRQSG